MSKVANIIMDIAFIAMGLAATALGGSALALDIRNPQTNVPEVTTDASEVRDGE